MNKIADVVKLMAKTGLFFANVDGIYSRKEERYIKDFISGIEQIGTIDDDLRAEILQSLNRKYTLTEVVGETRSLLDGFSADERAAILDSIKGFINKVIRADGHVHPLEDENYKAWKRAFGVS